MNFKEIQLAGFKSFADKTSIKFDDGVTCIVGPNGCGKSNVADAVRWVLGEQSAKTLRGSSMQDVIFNGTQERRALSYCEVTLVFDNTSRLFDIEYDEVAMTRRLYRSGESEYLLNKQPCRLKDIVALLHGVGIGKEGYSIIGQGKVEQIMNAKPEERRAIFEEATGVMKFKAQKGEIERKLESAGDNLTVFVQRMDEAEKQLKPLEKQAETAKKYREFSADLKYEEVNTYLARCENFEYETKKHRARIAEATEGLEKVEASLSDVDEREAAARENAAAQDEELRSLNEKLRVFEVGLEHKSGEARVLGERIASYKRRLSAASEDVEYSAPRRSTFSPRAARKSGRRAKSGTPRSKRRRRNSPANCRRRTPAFCISNSSPTNSARARSLRWRISPTCGQTWGAFRRRRRRRASGSTKSARRSPKPRAARTIIPASFPPARNRRRRAKGFWTGRTRAKPNSAKI